MTRRGAAPGAAARTAPPAAAPGSAGPPPAATYAPALGAGLQALTSRVQEMHQAIAGTTFDHLLRVPGLAVPTRIVQGVHDAIAQGVYAALRHGGGAAFALAAGAERRSSDPQRAPGPKEQAWRSAVNGVFGDSLAASGSALAVRMSMHAHGAPLAATPEALGGLRPRVALFIHGLACDERSWGLRTDAWQASPWADALGAGRPVDYGALLEHEPEFGLSAIALRYNTGLAIDSNAAQLAAWLDRATEAAPQVREWLLIGHSMGGLVARRAHECAQADGLRWAGRAPMIVCLGSPHQGAPLEKLGHAATTALNLATVTKPLGRIAGARSQGIRDLRHGLKRAPKAAAPPALRMLYGSLGDAGGGTVGSLVGTLFGDGLVRAGSAADDGANGDVERVELAGLGHMALLNHPRVYAVLRRWLGSGAT